MEVLKLVKFMFKEHRTFPLLVILFSTATILSSVGLFGYSSYLIAFCALHPDVSMVMTTVVLIRLFGVSRAALRYVERITSHNTTFKMIKSIRTWLYKKVTGIEYAEVVVLDKERVLTHLMDDVESLQDFYLRTFNPFITSIAVGLLGVLILTLFSSTIALIFILFYILCIIVLPLILWWYGQGLNKKNEEISGTVKVKVMDFFNNFIEIIVNNTRSRARMEIDLEQEKGYQLEFKLAKLKTFSSQMNLLLSNFALFFCLFAGVKLVSEGKIQGVLLPMLILIVFSLFEGALPVGELFHKLEIVKHSTENIFKLESLAEEESRELNIAFESIEKIEANCVSYMYPNADTYALRELSFSIHKGEKIAIVGQSGSGKSTLSQVILSWLEPQGELLYNGKTKEKILKSSIENAVALVAQKSYFFHTNIRNNMRIANDDVEDSEIIQVLYRVGLTRWYQTLEKGLESSVGENAMLLSGGERQRLALARALLSKRNFIILDEITAGLDVHMEAKIMEMIFENFDECGIITITHRLTYMNQYDKIYVMSNGRLVESGTHSELLANRGAYFILFEVQSKII